MALLNKKQLTLLFVFYKSTLSLSLTTSALLAIISPDFVTAFGICLLSAGTVISLLYHEISRQHTYYFYYNMGIPKWALILTCCCINVLAGLSLIICSHVIHT